MTLDNTKTAASNLTYDEYGQLIEWAHARRHELESQATQDQGKAALISDLRGAGTIPDPAPETVNGETVDDWPAWVDPGTDHTRMYLADQVVSHGGRLWRSQVDGLNSWEPGGSGVYDFIWSDVTDELLPPPEEPADPEEPEDPEQPAAPQWDGNSTNYTAGQHVTYNGVVYEVIQPHTSQPGWTPDTVAALYRPL